MTRPMSREVAAQIDGTYRRMAREARYRPCAPGDGFGNITVPVAELNLDAECRDYAAGWWDEENVLKFGIGCCVFETRPATIFAVEAARLLCGTDKEMAAKLLRMALRELEKLVERKRKFETDAEYADWVVSQRPPLSDEDMTLVRRLLGGNPAHRERAGRSERPMSAMSEVALWYWRHHSIDYSLWASEEEAAEIAAAMTDDGGASIAGIQFPDGRLIPRDEWAAYAAAVEAQRRAWDERVPEKPHPKRKITAPFGGETIEIDAGEPTWLGEVKP